MLGFVFAQVGRGIFTSSGHARVRWDRAAAAFMAPERKGEKAHTHGFLKKRRGEE